MRSAKRPSPNRSTSFVLNPIWRLPSLKCKFLWWNFISADTSQRQNTFFFLLDLLCKYYLHFQECVPWDAYLLKWCVPSDFYAYRTQDALLKLSLKFTVKFQPYGNMEKNMKMKAEIDMTKAVAITCAKCGGKRCGDKSGNKHNVHLIACFPRHCAFTYSKIRCTVRHLTKVQQFSS